jgi:hypothetical protein
MSGVKWRLAILAPLAFVGCGSSEAVKPAKVTIADVVQSQPLPGDTELNLIAGGVGSCGGAQATEIQTEETGSEVVVRASLRVEDSGFGCEVRNATDGFTVMLDKPLRNRQVIDDSKGRRVVIWSSQVKAGIDAGQALTESDAQEFLLERRDGSDPRCVRVNARFFGCTYSRADTGRPSVVDLTVLPNGDLALGAK